jgi:hypothetical protein
MVVALIGVIGVLVGALASGAVAWWQARQASAAKRLAAARLVEAELRVAAGRLEWLRASLLPDALGNVTPADRREALLLFANGPAPTAWPEHRYLLAKTLDAGDWYAVVQAHEALETLRNPVTAEAMTQARSGEKFPALSESMDGYMLALWAEKVLAGAKAISALAGGSRRPGGEEVGGFYDKMIASLSGSADGLPPEISRADRHAESI